MVFDSIWLFQTLLVAGHLFFEVGLGDSAFALAPFATYKFISWVSLLPPAIGPKPGSPVRLLLLRTFGFRSRSERLFDQLSSLWRYAGPIQFIAAPDLASRSIEPPELLDFLAGRLNRRFVIEPSDLEKCLLAFDYGPDPDGRYRVNELFCGDDAWKDAVRRLMTTSDFVAMDLRGVREHNKGCIAELQFLMELGALGRTILLVDEATDINFLRPTLQNCWISRANASSSRDAVGKLTLLNIDTRETLVVNALLVVADNVLADADSPLSRRVSAVA